ncbi:MAG: hypothetical protein WC548_02070 [Candidatus Pacearchaeota archaeon]
MEEIDYEQASRRVVERFNNLSRELDYLWSIASLGIFQETPEKGYTARMDFRLFCSKRTQGAGEAVAILFSPDDATGNNDDYVISEIDSKWTPRKKVGEAELYVAIGSNVDGEWFPGLTSLEAVSIGENPIITHGYKRLTLSQQEYLRRLERGDKSLPHRRFDFTFDNSINFGNPHAIGFRNFPQGSPIIEYQIGVFVPFKEQYDELDFLRKKIEEQGV